METLSSGLKSASSPFLVYEEVDAEIEIINFDMSNSDTVDLELEPIVFEKEDPTDPNENKYSKTTKNKLALLKCEKNAYLEASKDLNEDLIREGQKVQQEYQDYNKKVSEGCFSQYNPYSLRDFVKSFIKFRKGKKCTQDDVRRGLENFMDKTINTLMISKFENMNLSGTKMVGIKKLLKFWMKIKSLEENQKIELRANQRSMLNDLRRGQVLNVPDDSVIDEQNVVAMEASNDDVLTTENEQTIARFKFDAGILTRQFDCAEISEKVDIDSGVKEKLQKLKQKERMRKEELMKDNVQMGKEETCSFEQEIGENVVKKKSGRPFSSQKGFKRGKRIKLEELTNPDQIKVVESVKRGKSRKYGKVKESKNKKKSEIVKPKKSNSKENKTPKMEKNNSRRRTRCGTCEACSRKDCGACKNCLKMVKFGGSGNTRQACKTRICPAKTHSGRKTAENGSKNGSNSRKESEASNRIVADLKPDCKESESFEEQMPVNIARVHLKLESSSGSNLPEDNARVEVDCDLMDEVPAPTSETLNDGQLEALSNEMPAALDEELLLASSSHSSGAGLSENPVQVASEGDGSNFKITFNNSPFFLNHMEMLMATEEDKADTVKKMKEENITFNNSPLFLTHMETLMATGEYKAENSQLTQKEHTYPEDSSYIRDQESAVLSQNRQPSEEMSINESPDAGADVPSPDAGGDVPSHDAGGDVPSPDAGADVPSPDAGGDVPSPDAGADVPMAASVTDVLKSNTGGHILASGTSGEIQESDMDGVIQECNTDGSEVIELVLQLSFD